LSNKKHYEKHQSFHEFRSKLSDDEIGQIKSNTLQYLTTNIDNNSEYKADNYLDILQRAQRDLLSNKSTAKFKITPFIADELKLLEDFEILPYIYHRYRYDIFPQIKELDKFPPYIQIEPTSICNFRCVFCYQTDKKFSDKRSGFMGNMKPELFKDIIDQIEGNIEFLSLSSRGEPTINKNFSHMLDYCQGKFLNLKVNTNASLLTDDKIHALLNGAAKTIVFSVDAADEKLYKKLRVNGDFNQVLKNIERFQQIRETQYSKSKILTRVSGVMVDSKLQSSSSLIDFWETLVDQVTFVKYNPWENIYEQKPNKIKQACSDLWRRMFIWHDGIANPCDSDYRSSLTVGTTETTIENLWSSEQYNKLRSVHLQEQRTNVHPCNRCSVI